MREGQVEVPWSVQSSWRKKRIAGQLHRYLLWLERGFAYANGCPDSSEGRDVVKMRIYAIDGNMFWGEGGLTIGWMSGGGPLG